MSDTPTPEAKPTAAKTPAVAATVDQATYDHMVALAEAGDRNLAGEVRRAIKAHVKANPLTVAAEVDA